MEEIRTVVNKQTKDMLLGSEVVAHAVKLCRPHVIAAYPITPQTHIVETLSNMVESGELSSEYIKVESEMSAIASCYGAVAVGSRSFTATSSQGLAFMHEMLHWFSGSRFPFVMVNANRALGAPWSIWTDQSDSMSQRDTGWIQFYCETAQEIMDTIIQAYWISEKMMLPAMVMIDGFILSHTMEGLYMPDQSLVDHFLPAYKAPYLLDVQNPLSFGAATTGDSFYNFKKMIAKTMKSISSTLSEGYSFFNEVFERQYSNCEGYRVHDAETVLLTSGAITGTVRVAVDKLRDMGMRVGVVKLRLFRPFPKEQLIEVIGDARDIIVLNRAVSYGAGGTLTQETRAAFYNMRENVKIYDVIISIGGKEIYPETVVDIVLAKDKLSFEDSIWL